jgi:hypothetical protein
MLKKKRKMIKKIQKEEKKLEKAELTGYEKWRRLQDAYSKMPDQVTP